MGATQQMLLSYKPAWNWLLNSLVSYYKMDGNANDELWTYNWTPTFITWDSTNKIIWQSASLNWVTSKIDLPSLSIWSTFSINMWIRFSWTNTNKIFLFEPNTAAFQSAFWWDTWQNRLEYYHWNGASSTKIQLAAWTYNDNVIRMFTITKTWTNVQIFVNWSSVASNSSMHNISITSANSSAFWYIARLWIQHYWWQIDETWIWNKVLSTTEITALYNSWSWLAYNFFTT